MLLRGELRKYAENLSVKKFESALYSTSGSIFLDQTMYTHRGKSIVGVSFRGAKHTQLGRNGLFFVLFINWLELGQIKDMNKFIFRVCLPTWKICTFYVFWKPWGYSDLVCTGVSCLSLKIPFLLWGSFWQKKNTQF